MNKVAHAFLTTLFLTILTMLTAIAWSHEPETIPNHTTPISNAR